MVQLRRFFRSANPGQFFLSPLIYERIPNITSLTGIEVDYAEPIVTLPNQSSGMGGGGAGD